MDKRAASGRGEPIPSILKKPKGRRKGDLLDKSSKIKREKVAEAEKKSGDASAPLPLGCTPLMYACQQADYKAVVDTLNKDVSCHAHYEADTVINHRRVENMPHHSYHSCMLRNTHQ